MKPLYLDFNLGLGDAIIQNGLVRTLAKERDVFVPCWAHNFPTVSHMFSDLEQVAVMVVEGDGIPTSEQLASYGARDMEILSVGINYHGPIDCGRWDENFYLRADVPFDAKWGWFHVPTSNSEFPVGIQGKFLLMHDDPRRDFTIARSMFEDMNRRAVIKVEERGLLTDWRRHILEAGQIHVIDSSFMHLVELMPTTGKLFYHKYARAQGSRQHTDAVLRKDWRVYE